MKGVFNNRGSALLQALVASAMVMGLGVYMMSSRTVEDKTRLSTKRVVTNSVLVRNITESFSDYDSCVETFRVLGELKNDMIVPQILNKNGGSVYAPGSRLGAQEMMQMKLTGFVPAEGLRFQNVSLKIFISDTSNPKQAGYGGADTAIDVPLFMFSLDNRIQICTTDASGAVKDAFRDACEDFGGEFSETSGQCMNIDGRDGVIVKRIKREFCDANGGLCVHPYRVSICKGTDPRGVDWQNRVVTGLNGKGDLSCKCIPQECPNPAQYCAGEDLGTNHCDQICPQGTRLCPPHWDYSSWSGCSATCGSGTRTRTGRCLDYRNRPIADSECGPGVFSTSCDAGRACR